MIPNWIRKVIPRVSNHRTHFATQFREFAPNKIAFQQHFSSGKGNIGNRTLFMVCHDCNTGWMKDIQDEAKPILTPLIKGKWDSLGAHQGPVIAKWMAMTASVIAMSFRKTGGVAKADRYLLREQQTATDDWHVFVGRGSGFHEVEYSNRVMAVIQRSERYIAPAEANTSVTTIALRQLLIHSINIPNRVIPLDPAAYGRQMGVFPVHPWGGARLDQRWIPVIAANSADFLALKDAYYRAATNPNNWNI